MPVAAGKRLCLWLEAPTSVCLSFATKQLAPQKMKLCGRKVPSLRNVVRHSFIRASTKALCVIMFLSYISLKPDWVYQGPT